MQERAMAGVTALVTGASRGFGRGIAAARGGPGGVLTPEQVGRAVTGLVTGPDIDQDACLVTAAGPRPLP